MRPGICVIFTEVFELQAALQHKSGLSLSPHGTHLCMSSGSFSCAPVFNNTFRYYSKMKLAAYLSRRRTASSAAIESGFTIWTDVYVCNGVCRTANRNARSLKWPVIGLNILSQDIFSKAWIQSQEEVQKSSVLSDNLNYNMLKGYYGIFARWCQK